MSEMNTTSPTPRQTPSRQSNGHASALVQEVVKLGLDDGRKQCSPPAVSVSIVWTQLSPEGSSPPQQSRSDTAGFPVGSQVAWRLWMMSPPSLSHCQPLPALWSLIRGNLAHLIASLLYSRPTHRLLVPWIESCSSSSPREEIQCSDKTILYFTALFPPYLYYTCFPRPNASHNRVYCQKWQHETGPSRDASSSAHTFI